MGWIGLELGRLAYEILVLLLVSLGTIIWRVDCFLCLLLNIAAVSRQKKEIAGGGAGGRSVEIPRKRLGWIVALGCLGRTRRPPCRFPRRSSPSGCGYGNIATLLVPTVLMRMTYFCPSIGLWKRETTIP